MKFDHIALCVDNIHQSIVWYEDNFNAQVKYWDDSWAMLDICGTQIALTLADKHPPHIAFSIDPAEDWQSGIEVNTHRDKSQYVYKKDPSGNTIELIKYIK